MSHIQQRLFWEVQPGSTGYHFQLSTSNTFSPLLDELTYTRETSYLTGPLEAGTYYWRVRGVGLDEVGAWSEAVSFTVQADWEQPEYPPVPSDYSVCIPVLRRG